MRWSPTRCGWAIPRSPTRPGWAITPSPGSAGRSVPFDAEGEDLERRGPARQHRHPAMRYEPATGMFDASYAAAWQIGRLLAVQNLSFATALVRLEADAGPRHGAGRRAPVPAEATIGDTTGASPRRRTASTCSPRRDGARRPPRGPRADTRPGAALWRAATPARLRPGAGARRPPRHRAGRPRRLSPQSMPTAQLPGRRRLVVDAAGRPRRRPVQLPRESTRQCCRRSRHASSTSTRAWVTAELVEGAMWIGSSTAGDVAHDAVLCDRRGLRRRRAAEPAQRAAGALTSGVGLAQAAGRRLRRRQWRNRAGARRRARPDDPAGDVRGGRRHGRPRRAAARAALRGTPGQGPALGDRAVDGAPWFTAGRSDRPQARRGVPPITAPTFRRSRCPPTLPSSPRRSRRRTPTTSRDRAGRGRSPQPSSPCSSSRASSSSASWRSAAPGGA